MTPQQARMARAALGLGVRDLASLANVSPNSVARFERGEATEHATVDALAGALERAGVRFVAPGTSDLAEGPGVVALPSARGSGTGTTLSAFQRYKAQATKFRPVRQKEDDAWRRVRDWYLGGGRDLFIEAFTAEVGVKLNVKTDAGARLNAALPKGLPDYAKKAADPAFYRSNAEWFLLEMDQIIASVPRESDEPDATFPYGNVLRFVQHVLLDSVVLFADWGNHCAPQPKSYGMVKNEATHLVQLFHGARQIIYGHGSFGLSFVENHSDIAIGIIRQSVELRLRRAFGLQGKELDGVLYPVPLLELLNAIDAAGAGIELPVPFAEIKRVNGWANVSLHGGLKAYAWAPPRVLDHLRPFLIGGPSVNGRLTVNAGVAATQSAFEAVRSALVRQIKGQDEAPKQNARNPLLILLPPNECDVVLLETKEA